MNNQYALAFFQIAKEDNVLEPCKESFEVLIELLKNDLEFSSFLNSPKIKTAEKQNFLKKVLSSCEQDFLYFLYVLLDNNRINEIDEIFKSFLYCYNEENKIKSVLVLSASKLEEKEIFELYNSLKKYYIGYEISIDNKIDPKVIGGYHILVNGLSIDLSVKRKIDSLKSTL